jgi:hypothetical protein
LVLGVVTFTDEQKALIRERSGCDPAVLAALVRACGFDAAGYLRESVDLRAAGFDAVAALAHFLAHGFDEQRQPVCGVVGDGLAGLGGLEPGYARRLVRSLYFGQLRNPRSGERLWAGADRGLIAVLRRHGGVPYFVIGDSHSNHYVQRAARGEAWLAAMPLVCAGALGRAQSREPFGPRILRWAATAGGLDVPVFLKFGGIDAELLWVRARLRARARDFPLDAYAAYATEAVARYARFLEVLGGLIGFGVLRVCAVFPSAVVDAAWAAAFLGTFRDEGLAEAVREAAIPDLRGRTVLRGMYNAALRTMCAAKGWVFVDDFSPLLGADGVLDARYFQAAGGSVHVDHAATAPVISGVIWGAV